MKQPLLRPSTEGYGYPRYEEFLSSPTYRKFAGDMPPPEAGAVAEATPSPGKQSAVQKSSTAQRSAEAESSTAALRVKRVSIDDSEAQVGTS